LPITINLQFTPKAISRGPGNKKQSQSFPQGKRMILVCGMPMIAIGIEENIAIYQFTASGLPGFDKSGLNRRQP
jgi:hypothetical protein